MSVIPFSFFFYACNFQVIIYILYILHIPYVLFSRTWFYMYYIFFVILIRILNQFDFINIFFKFLIACTFRILIKETKNILVEDNLHHNFNSVLLQQDSLIELNFQHNFDGLIFRHSIKVLSFRIFYY